MEIYLNYRACQSRSLCQRAIGLLLILISFQWSNSPPVDDGPRKIFPSKSSSVLFRVWLFTDNIKLVWWSIPTGMWNVRVSLNTGLLFSSLTTVFFCFRIRPSWMRETSTYEAVKKERFKPINVIKTRYWETSLVVTLFLIRTRV